MQTRLWHSLGLTPVVLLLFSASASAQENSIRDWTAADFEQRGHVSRGLAGEQHEQLRFWGWQDDTLLDLRESQFLALEGGGQEAAARREDSRHARSFAADAIWRRHEAGEATVHQGGQNVWHAFQVEPLGGNRGRDRLHLPRGRDGCIRAKAHEISRRNLSQRHARMVGRRRLPSRSTRRRHDFARCGGLE